MIEQIEQSYQRQMAAEVRALRMRKLELQHRVTSIRQQINDITQQIDEHIGTMTRDAVQRIDAMTDDEAATILAAADKWKLRPAQRLPSGVVSVPSDSEIAAWDQMNAADPFE